MKKIQILIVQHKEAEVFSNNVYIPIQVGKTLSNVDLGIQGDDTGDNISKLNPYFCELTAQYWAWKNMHDVEYIGLCHYRRYFKTEFTEHNIDALMGNHDLILVRHLSMPYSVLRWSVNGLVEEDFYIFVHYLYKRFPKYKNVIDSYFYGNKCWPCNMFVMKKSLFDDFAQWQFSILFDLNKLVRTSPYSRLKRMMGYFAEHLLHLYAVVNQLRVKEEPIVEMQGQTKELYGGSWLGKLKCNFKYHLCEKKYVWNYAVINGLKADGILDKISFAK